jgi:S-adenosylmethionine decarboxylase
LIKNNVGKHVLVDMHGCDPELLKKVDFISDAMHQAAKKSKATIVGKFFKQFDPWGVSGVIVIAESHISIHTWPEHGLASIDYFSCSDEPMIHLAVEHLSKMLGAKEMQIAELRRGNMEMQRCYEVRNRPEVCNEMAV